VYSATATRDIHSNNRSGTCTTLELCNQVAIDGLIPQGATVSLPRNGAERCRHGKEEDRGVAAGAVIDVRIYVARSDEVIE